MTAVVAVDFGAASIRVCLVDLAAAALAVDVVHRYAHAPVADAAGHLRWDWVRLVAELEKGLAAAEERGPVASIGVDTWGVDYGLLDADGELLSPPFSYRDARTDGWRAVVDRIGEAELWATTGLQLLPFNTLFQVAAHDGVELAQARCLLTLPELLVHHLTGEIVAEATSAGTTGLVDISTGTWSARLADAVRLDPAMLPTIRRAGTCAGSWHGIPVHLVGGHDTASAVAAMGARPAPGAAFASSGTWLLVGQERGAPDLSEASRAAGLTNEIGALGGVRLLKNLAGWWLLEGCRSAWGDPPLDGLLAAADDASAPSFDVADSRFLHPDDMLGAVTDAAGLDRDAPPPVVTRCIIEAMADGTAAVLDALGGASELHVFGGGARAGLYRSLVADRAGIAVHAGPVEATALGNALVQGVALGVFADLAGARTHLEGTSP